MHLSFTKSLLLVLLIAFPKKISADEMFNKVVGTGIVAAIAGLVTWSLWPDSDETVVNKADGALQNVLQEHDMFLKNMESLIGGFINEASLEMIAQRVSSPSAQCNALRIKREELNSNLTALEGCLKSLSRNQYNAEQKALYTRALSLQQRLLDLILRLKNVETILQQNENYFNFYHLKQRLQKKYEDELSYFSVNALINARKNSGKFPLMNYEQDLSSDIASLERCIHKIDNYSQAKKELNFIKQKLEKNHAAILDARDYKYEVNKYEKEERERREREEKRREEERKRKEKERERRRKEEELRQVFHAAEQFVTDVAQSFKEAELQERERRVRQQEQEAQKKPVVYVNILEQKLPQESVQSVKHTILMQTRAIARDVIVQMRRNPPCNPELLKPINIDAMIDIIVATIEAELDWVNDANQLKNNYNTSILRSKIEYLAQQHGVYEIQEQSINYDQFEPVLYIPQYQYRQQSSAPSAPSMD